MCDREALRQHPRSIAILGASMPGADVGSRSRLKRKHVVLSTADIQDGQDASLSGRSSRK